MGLVLLGAGMIQIICSSFPLSSISSFGPETGALYKKIFHKVL